MSAPLSTAAQNAALDGMLGSGKASGMPATFELALFNGDPRGTGVELSSTGGYARVTGITNNSTNFPNASGGSKTGALQTFATSTAAWSDTAVWFVFYDAADHTTAWFHGPLTDAVLVTGSGTVVEVTPVVPWNAAS